VFCVSAGNEANGSHWDGPWQDAGNGYMDFGGGDEFFRIEVNGTSEEVVVQSDADWSTEAGYVVELYDANENFVKSASRSTTPATSVSVPSPGTHYLKIGDEGLDGTEHFDLFPWIGVDFPVSTSARSLGIPATCPDSTTLTTAAVRHGTDELEAFSSRGPTQDGRRGVDVSAPDGTVSDTYDGEFYGTSAAAPHAAGAAALLAGFPAVDNEDVVEALTSTARDISDPEVPAPTNRRIGYGYVELGGGLDDLAGLLREGLWAPDNGRSQRASPAVDADRVYVGGLGSDVVAYRRGDGRAWTYTRDGALSDSSPVVVGDTVYVGGGGGRLHALGAADGRVRWTHATDSAVTSTPAVAEGQVYFGTNDGVVRAVAASDGTELWTTGVGGPVYSEVATASGLVFVTTTGGDLVCLDATTGVEQWRFATGTDLGAASPLVANGRVFVAADAVYAFDASAVRTRQWDASYGGTVGGSPAYGDGTVFVGDAHESLVALDDANGGTERWVRTIGGAFETRPTVAGDRVLAPSDTGYLYAFLTDGTEIGRTELPGESRSSPAVDGDDIYLGTRSGALVRH
jgi:outer membrane protein assembly factor BamB